jgi:hypothetical protein
MPLGFVIDGRVSWARLASTSEWGPLTRLARQTSTPWLDRHEFGAPWLVSFRVSQTSRKPGLVSWCKRYRSAEDGINDIVVINGKRASRKAILKVAIDRLFTMYCQINLSTFSHQLSWNPADIPTRSSPSSRGRCRNVFNIVDRPKGSSGGFGCGRNEGSSGRVLLLLSGREMSGTIHIRG